MEGLGAVGKDWWDVRCAELTEPVLVTLTTFATGKFVWEYLRIISSEGFSHPGIDTTSA